MSNIEIILHSCEAIGWATSFDNRIISRPLSQPRGRKTPPLVPEFKAVKSITLPKIPPIDNKKRLRNAVYDIPAGSKLLRAEAKRGRDESDAYLCVFGIYHSMMEFCNIATSVQHPFDDFMHIPDMLLECVCDILRMGPIAISKKRLQTITQLKALRLNLEKDEAVLHRSLPEHLNKLLSNKQLLLLKKLADDIGWPDMHLHEKSDKDSDWLE